MNRKMEKAMEKRAADRVAGVVLPRLINGSTETRVWVAKEIKEAEMDDLVTGVEAGGSKFVNVYVDETAPAIPYQSGFCYKIASMF